MFVNYTYTIVYLFADICIMINTNSHAGTQQLFKHCSVIKLVFSSNSIPIFFNFLGTFVFPFCNYYYYNCRNQNTHVIHHDRRPAFNCTCAQGLAGSYFRCRFFRDDKFEFQLKQNTAAKTSTRYNRVVQAMRLWGDVSLLFSRLRLNNKYGCWPYTIIYILSIYTIMMW